MHSLLKMCHHFVHNWLYRYILKLEVGKKGQEEEIVREILQ